MSELCMVICSKADTSSECMWGCIHREAHLKTKHCKGPCGDEDGCRVDVECVPTDKKEGNKD